MTNAEIIFNSRVFLMEQGVLKGIPGTEVTFKDEDGERTVMMPEEIHTFAEWKRLGYMVQKGEHAVAKFPIWKKAGKKQEEPKEDEKMEVEAGGGRFFKKMAFFFTREQVKEVEA